MMIRIAFVVALVASTLSGAYAEDVLTATTALPKNVIYSRTFLKWVARVNEQGKGIVRIDYRGGPEAIPMFEQGAALRSGVVDMIDTPSNYYVGLVPETDAIVGGNVPRAETRKNGGWELLNKIHQKKMNAYLLANFQPMGTFHIYLRNAPKFKPDGMIDTAGLKLRGAPIYREFFVKLGATFVTIPPAEVYTALERGTVDGLGWPRLGIMDANWDKFLKYRLDPGFDSVDVVVLVNLKKWNSLSPKSRELLQKMAIEYENETFKDDQKEGAKEEAELKRRGMKFVSMKPQAAKTFLNEAYQVDWDRLKHRDPTNVDALRAKFYRPQ